MISVTNFTPASALAGGALIGLGSAVLLLGNRRIAGISGIVGGLLTLSAGDRAWRLVFIAGLMLGVWLYAALAGGAITITIDADWPLLIAGGLLVGFGTRLGGGCTSGHGVCGISRASPRSIVATLVFMLVAAITVFVLRHGFGGGG
ncbi:MAG: YeeE/YedE family protein [Wenzhouxiangellaceae bacterium]|nr:YeeE/YedE family protein [Wenzhouxiangellaceae bacterium]